MLTIIYLFEVTHGRDDITTGVNLSTVINPETRKVKRILHFSDGTLEESDSESQEDILDSHSAAPAGPGSKTLAQATIDPVNFIFTYQYLF